MDNRLISDLHIEEQEDTMRGRYITFTVEKETYGIEICYVTEIVGLQHISMLPEVPDYIKGIINLRGNIIPVIDMRLKFKKQPADYTDRTCIIVIDTGEISAGLIVDEVSEVISIEDGEISPPPSSGTGVNCQYLKGIGKSGGGVKLLLDCEKLFQEHQVQLNDNEQE